MRYRCVRCKKEIVEYPFYKLRYSSDPITEVYLCAPCVREWLDSWPKLPKGDKNEQTKLEGVCE